MILQHLRIKDVDKATNCDPLERVAEGLGVNICGHSARHLVHQREVVALESLVQSLYGDSVRSF